MAPNSDGTATHAELMEFWEDTLEAAGLGLEPEEGHERDVPLETVDDDVLMAVQQRFELGG